MKRIVFILILLISSILISTELEDLRFAIGLYKDNNYKLAKTELIKFIEENPESKFILDANFLLGNSYLRLREYKQANMIFGQLKKKNVDPSIKSEILLGLGQSEYFLGNLSKSRTYLDQFILKYPDDLASWNAYNFLAKISQKEGKFANAYQYLDQAEKLSSDRAIIYTRFITLMLEKKLEKVDELFSDILRFQDDPKKFEIIIKYLDFNLQNDLFRKIIDLKEDIIPENTQYHREYRLILGIAHYNLNNYSRSLDFLQDLDSEKSSYYTALSYLEIDREEDAKRILENLTYSKNIEIQANALFYLIKLETDNNKAIAKYQDFVENYPHHQFISIANYQIGYRYFLKKNYEKTLNYFDTALKSDTKLPSSILDKLHFLNAETYFNLEKYDQAIKSYLDYTESFDFGQFMDETVFKLGIIKFKEQNELEAKEYFSTLVNNYPNSSKLGMGYYYLGEISLKSKDHVIAEEYYRKALNGKCDESNTWLRIAYIQYIDKRYDLSLLTLKNVENTEKYFYMRNMLSGRINFAKRNYQKALDAYTFAEEMSKDKEKDEALIQKAWTLYKMQRFNEASQLYSRLSSTAISPEEYIFKAASAAFSAENYLRSIELFKKYVDNFPKKKDYQAALISLADAFYNLGDFSNAVKHYKKLIKPNGDDKIINNALNGLRWSAEQDDAIDYLFEISQFLQVNHSQTFRIKILDRKIHYEYKEGMWNEVIATAKDIELLAEDFNKLEEILLLKALSYYELEEYERSQSVFSQLESMNPSAEVLMNWAEVYIKQNDPTFAIKKLRSASMKSRRNDLWLRLLQLELAQQSEYFENDYHKFFEFAKGENKQVAELKMIEYNINNNEFAGFEKKLNNLRESKYKTVKSQAQFLKGFALFKKKEFEKAIPELLRVRYLFPEFIKIRNRAEAFACLSYLRSDQKDKALQLYESIKKDIPPELKQQINNLIKKGAEK